MAPDDQTVVVLERPCHPHTEAWEQSDNTLRNSAVDLLATQGFIEGDGDVVAVDHRALPFAYPILEVGAHDKANRLKAYLDHFNNLHLLGRSARFTYTHVHNLYARARRLTERIAPRAESVA